MTSVDIFVDRSLPDFFPQITEIYRNFLSERTAKPTSSKEEFSPAIPTNETENRCNLWIFLLIDPFRIFSTGCKSFIIYQMAGLAAPAVSQR